MKVVGTLRPDYFYKNYVQHCLRMGHPVVSKEDFLKAIKAYTNVMAGILITEGRVTFPGTIFTLDISREKKKVVDFTTVKEWGLRRAVEYNFNEHTFGYSARFGIDDHGLKKINFYRFLKTNKLKIALSAYLRSEPRNILKYRIKHPRIDDK